MKQYIDKSAIVAEIERRKECIRMAFSMQGILHGHDRAYASAQYDAFNSLLSFIDTIEVKENDLVEELDYNDYMTFFKEHPEYNNGDWGFEETWTFGQYCYKLGLKAQKG